jgi:hypothetical protein
VRYPSRANPCGNAFRVGSGTHALSRFRDIANGKTGEREIDPERENTWRASSRRTRWRRDAALLVRARTVLRSGRSPIRRAGYALKSHRNAFRGDRFRATSECIESNIACNLSPVAARYKDGRMCVDDAAGVSAAALGTTPSFPIRRAVSKTAAGAGCARVTFLCRRERDRAHRRTGFDALLRS